MKLEHKKKVLESILTTIDDETIISEMIGLLEVEPEPIKSLNYYLKNYLKQVEDDEICNVSLNPIKSGLSDFDNHTGGWKNGTLNIVAAHKGNGLRAFLITVLGNMAIKNKQEVAIFGLNNTAECFTNYILASETAISSKKLESKTLEKHEITQLNKKIAPLLDAPIYIDDAVPLTVTRLKNKIKQLIAEKEIKIVLMQNLEKIEGKRELVLKDLNKLAIELQIPMVAFYELDINWIETLKLNHKPSYKSFTKKYTDFGFHDHIETLTLIYRPEYYHISEWDDKTSCENQAELIFYGKDFENQSIRVKFISHLGKFMNL